MQMHCHTVSQSVSAYQVAGCPAFVPLRTQKFQEACETILMPTSRNAMIAFFDLHSGSHLLCTRPDDNICVRMLLRVTCAPGVGTTATATASPSSSCGHANTVQPATVASVQTTSSIRRGESFSPARLMSSLKRPVRKRYPSASKYPWWERFSENRQVIVMVK